METILNFTKSAIAHKATSMPKTEIAKSQHPHRIYGTSSAPHRIAASRGGMKPNAPRRR